MADYASAVLPDYITAVVFDIGETLVDETRAWSAQAEAAGLTPLTLFAALGALIDRGEDHNKLWDLLAIESPRVTCRIEAHDLYPDALPCLARLAGAGYVLGLAGNQPIDAEEAVLSLGLPVSFVASSARWKVKKPSPEFFAKVVTSAGCPAGQIAYVGDRLDNDIGPARRAGMWTAFIRRGPWGYLHSRLPEAAGADARIAALTDLLPAPGRG